MVCIWHASESFPYRTPAALEGEIDPEGNGLTAAKSVGIESRAGSGQRGRKPCRLSYASARRAGLLRTMLMVGRNNLPGHRREVPSKAVGVRQWTHGEIARSKPP